MSLAADGVRRSLRRLGGCRKGATALEFAIILPAFVMLIVGGTFSAGLVFTLTAMHFAVEDGARCASVQTTVCSSSSSTVSYTQSRYMGPPISPTFTYSATGCGHTVTGTVTYALNVGLTAFSIPLSASACHP
jgi:Flp pilus assembly protein TadG